MAEELTTVDATELTTKQESHFLDFKSHRIAPGKLSVTLTAMSNGDGGEVVVGIENNPRVWSGFNDIESANSHIQILEQIFGLSGDAVWRFLGAPKQPGVVLHITILKNGQIRKATDGNIYIRKSAQNLQLTTPEQIRNLELAKGLSSFESQTVSTVTASEIESSPILQGLLAATVPSATPRSYLTSQRLLINEKPTTAAVLLFLPVPQTVLPKSAIKIYRYKTKDAEGDRENLAETPGTIDGPIYDLVKQAVERTASIIESVGALRDGAITKIEYPKETLHEIITNAILHRDYAINDDIHIRIFDNRVEVESPGRLPAHVTPQNILHERFARNQTLVRLINKFPNPPNMDVGEGLNTAFSAMKKRRLKEPNIFEKDNSVLVVIRHEPLATAEEQIVEFLRSTETINNTNARNLTGTKSPIEMRKIFKRMVTSGVIEQVPGTLRATSAYRLPRRR